jgi:hypothetical protein
MPEVPDNSKPGARLLQTFFGRQTSYPYVRSARNPLMQPASPLATLEPVRFGEFLLHRNLISDEQWLAALAQHWSLAVLGKRSRIGNAIVENGFLAKDVVEREARAFHDEIDVVEIIETAPRSERVTVPVPHRS